MRNGAMLTHTVLRWWNPRQCKPKQGQIVVATVSYKIGTFEYTRELAILTYWRDIGYELATVTKSMTLSSMRGRIWNHMEVTDESNA